MDGQLSILNTIPSKLSQSPQVFFSTTLLYITLFTPASLKLFIIALLKVIANSFSISLSLI